MASRVTPSVIANNFAEITRGALAENVEANRARKGVPHRGHWIREQIQNACGPKAIERLRALGESDNRADQDVFWKVVGKSLPQHVQAEVGGVGSLAAECDAALKRAGLTMKTQLGDVDG